MTKPRQNEKKYHKEIVDEVNDKLLGWAYKAQRGFIKGVPDIEAKVPHLPLCKAEIKHEVYMKFPSGDIPINLTVLQRNRLRDMQKAKLSCGWAVFITVDKKTCVCFGTDPYVEKVIINFEAGRVRATKMNEFAPDTPTQDHYMEIAIWTKDQRLAAISKMLNLWTRPQLYSQNEETGTATSPTTPGLLKV